LVYHDKRESFGVVLIYKEEIEQIKLKNEVLSPKNRMKIATMIVETTGHKIGELFFKRK
jgi:hypothetical protein